MSKVRVRGVIEYQGKFLLARLKQANTYWCLPGGGVEPGEDILSALERELVEETGIKPVIGNLLFIHQIKDSNGYDLPEFLFHVTNGSDYLNIDLGSTSHGSLEIEEAAFIDPTANRILPHFLTVELPKLVQNNYLAGTKVMLTKMEV